MQEPFDHTRARYNYLAEHALSLDLYTRCSSYFKNLYFGRRCRKNARLAEQSMRKDKRDDKEEASPIGAVLCVR